MNRAVFKAIAAMLVMMLPCGLAPAGAEGPPAASARDPSRVEARGARPSASALSTGAKPSVRWPSRKDSAPAEAPAATPAPAPAAPRLGRHVGSFFEMDVPEGWDVYGNTRGTSHAVLARDPREPLRQAYYFSEMGPLYFSENQRALDRQVAAIGGQVPWYIDHPVVQPYAPSNFLRQFHVIMESGSSISQFIPQMAHLDDLEIISARLMPSAIPGGARELIRAVFRQDGRAGQGLFVATLVSVMPENGTPFVGWGYALMFTGITAPFYEFGGLEEVLAQSVASFQLSDAYVDQCLSIQRSTTGAIIERGRILNETSDSIMEGWTSRNQSEDIAAAKWSDAILGKERLYDPATGQVYAFENGFYGQYDLDRNRYAMSGLEPLPGDRYELWAQAPRDGYEHLH